MGFVDISSISLDDLADLHDSPLAEELTQMVRAVDEENRANCGTFDFNSALM